MVRVISRSDLTTAVRGVLAAASCAGLVTALVGVAGTLGAGLARPGARALEDAVTVACVVAGGGAFAVIGVGCLLTAVAAVARAGGRSVTRLESVGARLVPTVLRRTIALGVSAGLLAALAGPASAAEPDAQGSGPDSVPGTAVSTIELGWQVTSDAPLGAATGSPAAGATSDAPVPGGLPPDLGPAAAPADASSANQPVEAQPVPVAADVPDGLPPTTSAAPMPSTVTVQPGDSLWSIAAAHLGPGSEDAAVAATWPQWYAANRLVVGHDPNVIHPGQVLTAPVGEPA